MKVTKAYVIEVTLEELLHAIDVMRPLGAPIRGDKQYQLVQLDQFGNGNILIEVEEVDA